MHLIPQLIKKSVVQHGEFTYKSGKNAEIYCDFRKAFAYPRLLNQISCELGNLITDLDVAIVGVPLGALPYACAISSIFDLPMLIIRDKRKDYGMKNILEGDNLGKSCVVIEDVVTTGNSLLESIQILEDEGKIVKEIIIILDGESGGFQRVEKLGYKITALFKLSQLRNFTNHTLTNDLTLHPNIIKTKLLNIMNSKKSNLVFSADLNDPIEILDAIADIVDHICAVKLHLDIIHFTDMTKIQFLEYLNVLKNENNFLVIQDRKYSDIGSIVDQQVTQVAKYIDIVTAYGITGLDMLKTFANKDVGILLIHQLSSSQNLIDIKHSNMVKQFAQECPNVIGFITQSKVLDGYLHFTPGVSLNLTQDKKGQRYRTPDLLKNEGTDVFIVGRGIYQAANLSTATQEYQERCW